MDAATYRDAWKRTELRHGVQRTKVRAKESAARGGSSGEDDWRQEGPLRRVFSFYASLFEPAQQLVGGSGGKGGATKGSMSGSKYANETVSFGEALF